MKQILNTLFVVILVAIVGFVSACSETQVEKAEKTEMSEMSDLPMVMVYKSASCGCCESWIAHLEENGFKVMSHNMTDMAAVKDEHGVKMAHRSCHTALVDGYVVEGHVPAEDILKMLDEKPAIVGLTAPGMPGGSPGMESAPKQAYDVIAFTESGQEYVYARH